MTDTADGHTTMALPRLCVASRGKKGGEHHAWFIFTKVGREKNNLTKHMFALHGRPLPFSHKFSHSVCSLDFVPLEPAPIALAAKHPSYSTAFTKIFPPEPVMLLCGFVFLGFHIFSLSVSMLAEAQVPLRRLPRNFPVRRSFGEVGVMEFGLADSEKK